jgi:hypothetical protein
MELINMDPIEQTIRFNHVKRALQKLKEGYIEAAKKELEEALWPGKHLIETECFAPVLPYRPEEDYNPWCLVPIDKDQKVYYHWTAAGRLQQLYFVESDVWVTTEQRTVQLPQETLNRYYVAVTIKGHRVAYFVLDEKPWWFADYYTLRREAEGTSSRALLRMIIVELLRPFRPFKEAM